MNLFAYPCLIFYSLLLISLHFFHYSDTHFIAHIKHSFITFIWIFSFSYKSIDNKFLFWKKIQNTLSKYSLWECYNLCRAPFSRINNWVDGRSNLLFFPLTSLILLAKGKITKFWFNILQEGQSCIQYNLVV